MDFAWYREVLTQNQISVKKKKKFAFFQNHSKDVLPSNHNNLHTIFPSTPHHPECKLPKNELCLNVSDNSAPFLH